jgi:ribonuclease-3
MDTLEKRLGLVFKNRNVLRSALTHRSFLNETPDHTVTDNERLEFLGDALVDFVAADLLYQRLPESPEGVMTTLRSHLVREDTLAAYARELGLPAAVRLGRGEAASGGRDRPGMQCDAFEALIGAIYLDLGYATAERFLFDLFDRDLPLVVAERGKDAKSRLQELTQSLWQVTPTYVTVGEEGPEHRKRFVVEARVGERSWGRGEGASKAEAARVAAEAAIAKIGEEAAPPPSRK